MVRESEIAELGSPTDQSAVGLQAGILSGQWTAVEVCDAFIRKIRETHDDLNAVVVPRFEEARVAAKERDEQLRAGHVVGPLHGVPFTVKECFDVIGTASTMGLETRASTLAESTCRLVQRLIEAGGVLLGKTNVPQLMMWHECDNPVYGRTNHPLDAERTPGGSTGGEGAIIGAGGSPLGLGNDLGGSIRLPAHFCGIHGIKPTSGRLPRSGTASNFHGMEAMETQPGPLARRVEDLAVALSVLAKPDLRPTDSTSRVPLLSHADVQVADLRVGVLVDDGYFTPSPAIQRVVRESADRLSNLGCQVVDVTPPSIEEMVEIYFGLMSADGAADLRRLADGNTIDPRVRQLLRLGTMPRMLRRVLRSTLKLQGQDRSARLLGYGGAVSADGYWQLSHRKAQYVERFQQFMEHNQLDAVITPPHGLPAMLHGKPIDLFDASSYALLANVTGVPAGVVSVGKVQPGEESSRASSGDLVIRRALQVENNSAGLPVGVQVLANQWREDIVLAVMMELERSQAD